MTLSPRLQRLRDALTAIEERAPEAVVRLPLATVSLANEHAHWRTRQARAKVQRKAAILATRTAKLRLLASPLVAPWPDGLVVLSTRHAPRRLDSDNLAGALKSVRDGVARALGISDGDERVVWVVDQAKAPRPAVVVEFYWRRMTT